MTLRFIDVLRSYARYETGLAAVRDWLALCQWEADESEKELIDSVDSLLAFLDDGHISEDELRLNIHLLIRGETTQTVRFDILSSQPFIAPLRRSWETIATTEKVLVTA